ncbi:SDR family NAD(P)-dependent oxidoreductase [Streptomyces sp. NPDC090798]|uniref:SDR family NAD(P)-dependent oxidoreductase n=1 Tax=Streptomyces sp. NPDC090798 TaxID=3365968 RepID=UPI00382685FA
MRRPGGRGLGCSQRCAGRSSRRPSRNLARQGAEVVLHGRDQARGEALVKEIAAEGGTARFIAADLADAADTLRLAAAAGAVDILVSNAGLYDFAPTARSARTSCRKTIGSGELGLVAEDQYTRSPPGIVRTSHLTAPRPPPAAGIQGRTDRSHAARTQSADEPVRADPARITRPRRMNRRGQQRLSQAEHPHRAGRNRNSLTRPSVSQTTDRTQPAAPRGGRWGCNDGTRGLELPWRSGFTNPARTRSSISSSG